MAHFYVSIQGSRGDLHRLGGKSGGVKATLGSWDGGAVAQLYHKDGADRLRVHLIRWDGRGAEKTVLNMRVDGKRDAKPAKSKGDVT